MSTIAIDFGTSRTKVAYWDPSFERPQLMRFQYDTPFFPSLFYLMREGEQILWGYDAQDQLSRDPAGVIDILKRRLRERYVRANRRRVEPRQLLNVLLHQLRHQVGQEIAPLVGQAPSSVRLTLPALYGPTEEGLLREAAQQAGFAEVEIVPEPVAAARAWLTESKETSPEVVVVDCGGGTCDWAYLRRQGEDFMLVASCPPGGDMAIGGHDVDTELLEYLKDTLEEEGAQEIEEHAAYYLQQVRLVKERYCRGLPGRMVRVGQQHVELSESEIQAAIERRFIAQVCEGLKGYLNKVKEETKGPLPMVLLVGGSARLKGLKEAIEERFGCQTVWWERSEYATVLGAVPRPPKHAKVGERAVVQEPTEKSPAWPRPNTQQVADAANEAPAEQVGKVQAMLLRLLLQHAGQSEAAVKPVGKAEQSPERVIAPAPRANTCQAYLSRLQRRLGSLGYEWMEKVQCSGHTFRCVATRKSSGLLGTVRAYYVFEEMTALTISDIPNFTIKAVEYVGNTVGAKWLPKPPYCIPVALVHSIDQATAKQFVKIPPEVYKIPQSALTVMAMPAAYDLSADVLFVSQETPLSWLWMASKLRKEIQQTLTP